MSKLTGKTCIFALVFAAIIVLFAPGWVGAQTDGQVHSSKGQAVPIPNGLRLDGGGLPLPEKIAEAFLRMPYRVDGAIDDNGEYTLFADRSQRFSEPGINCSGFVLALSRFLLARNITLDEASLDRHGDSGPSSPHGHDWDFGWDLIMNISDGFPRRILLPGGRTLDPAKADAFSPRGYDMHAEQTKNELPARFMQGRLYLVSINVEERNRGYGLQHYHVGVVHVASGGQAWFYQTTNNGGGVNRRDLKTANGWDSMARAFANTGAHRKMMLVLEVDLPAVNHGRDQR